MHIERIQIEEGFLDGLDIQLVPGLNVIIGARGTGKTSLIELVRFCLGVRGYTNESNKRSRDHAISVLGTGQVTVTLVSGPQKITISRTISEDTPRASGPYPSPIIFSQMEIEAVGLQPGGRLQLLDGFVKAGRRGEAAEAEAVSTVRSLTSEAGAIRREIEELGRQIAGLPGLDQQLAELAPKEQQLANLSAETGEKKKGLDALSGTISASSVAAAAIERFSAAIGRWRTMVANVVAGTPAVEAWPEGAGQDPLASPRARIDQARKHIQAALNELGRAVTEMGEAARSTGQSRIALDDKARQLRMEIESLQTGAGAIVRQGQQLREKKAQLESLKAVSIQRTKDLNELLQRRGEALDRLDVTRDSKYEARRATADRLNRVLGPRIKIDVTRAGRFEAFAAAIADALRGSGMRFGDLAPALAERISPRELLEIVDSNDYDPITDAIGISRDRSARMLGQLKEADLGALATVIVDDAVSFQLLDGTDYKDISELSTGQRCTVVLPLVLRVRPESS